MTNKIDLCEWKKCGETERDVNKIATEESIEHRDRKASTTTTKTTTDREVRETSKPDFAKTTYLLRIFFVLLPLPSLWTHADIPTKTISEVDKIFDRTVVWFSSFFFYLNWCFSSSEWECIFPSFLRLLPSLVSRCPLGRLSYRLLIAHCVFVYFDISTQQNEQHKSFSDRRSMIKWWATKAKRKVTFIFPIIRRNTLVNVLSPKPLFRLV